jgi:hypothetical protein
MLRIGVESGSISTIQEALARGAQVNYNHGTVSIMTLVDERYRVAQISV